MTNTVVHLRAINQAKQEKDFYVELEDPNQLPPVLGTGRNAVVFLARTTPERITGATVYHAVKFLRDDVDKQYARTVAYRFFDEAVKAQGFHQQQTAFVSYYGWGAIGQPEPMTETGEKRDFWWEREFKPYKKWLLDNNEANNREYERIRKHYNLQGPFYVLQLCQGTLYDLLDKNAPWIDLPAYSISIYHESLESQAKRVADKISEVVRLYLERSPFTRSGYEILNLFRNEPEANRLRSRAVLQIFKQVADAVSQLHNYKPSADPSRQGRTTEPLAHRDLKPGNIFLQHDANANGLSNVRVQLSDLGYVTNADQIMDGDMTMREGKKGADYQAPGSQYYRAPEQAELPTEVRVDVEESDATLVQVSGSKINRVDVHDWLLLSDIFVDDQQGNTDAEKNLFKIQEVIFDPTNEYFTLRLNGSVASSRKSDLQGHIVRSTGFQTDGFSLGAILYDMISGGKNPQLFYTYCIVSLISHFSQEQYSVEAILNILAPAQQSEESARERLNLQELRRMLPALFDATSLDDLFDRLQQIAFSNERFTPRTALTIGDKTRLGSIVTQAKHVDELIFKIINSAQFKDGLMAIAINNIDLPVVNMTEQLKNYRFRAFSQVKDLLCDKRGVAIPREILRIVIACMVRDVEGAYYRRDAQYGYTSEQSFTATGRLRLDIEELLSGKEFTLPSQGFPELLEDDLLFKLRSLTLQANNP